jgi:hypothetical protein
MGYPQAVEYSEILCWLDEHRILDEADRDRGVLYVQAADQDYISAVTKQRQEETRKKAKKPDS